MLVYVRTIDAVASRQAAEIHAGTCDALDPAIKYALTPLGDGRSTTRIKNLQLASLLASPFAIDVASGVACGNITSPG